jgi:hypothetical protein
MSGILSAEHCARVSSWDENRRQTQKSKKISNRAKLIGFIAFNIAVWAIFLVPLLAR